jgi:hypothetical protein
MIQSCRNCPKHAQCESLCPEVEKLVPQDDGVKKYSPEMPVSQLKKAADEEEPDETRPATIDDFRKINPVADHADDIETEWDAQWDENPLLESDLTPTDHEKFNLDLLVPDRKIRGRFKAFLKCAKMTEIARRSNTSKQNIQKQFLRICKRIERSLLHGMPSHSITTPHQLKRRVAVEIN